MWTKSAVDFLLQATPWAPLIIRRGSSADISIKVTPVDEELDTEVTADREGRPATQHAGAWLGAGEEGPGRCLVWQFVVEAYDVGFQVLENGQADPQRPMTRYAAGNDDGEKGGVGVGAMGPVEVTAEGAVERARIGSIFTFRWDNSYSLVRHKRVHYRFLIVTSRSYAAALTAARDSEAPVPRATVGAGAGGAHGGRAQPQLAKRLALERRLTVDEVSMEQTRLIADLQRCVMDMVTAFMSEPDCPLHEGSVREFILALEAVLRNGIKEQYLDRWPEEPYFEFLLEIGTVLRDDQGLVAAVNALPPRDWRACLGWTRARALLFMALNKRILHHAFENLIKRRAVLENFYNSHALLYVYASAQQIAAYLSALNGVQFLLGVDGPSHAEDDVAPPNLLQCAPDAAFVDQEVITVPSRAMGDGFVYRTLGEEPDSLKLIEHCSIPRFVLTDQPIHELVIGRSADALIPLEAHEGQINCVLQIRVIAQDIAMSIVDGDKMALTEPIKLEAADEWVDVVFRLKDIQIDDIALHLDNSYSMVRTKQVLYRLNVLLRDKYDQAWEACQSIAQTISWKVATKDGLIRCEEHATSVRRKETDEVNQQRSRETSDTKDDLEDDTLLGLGASLITKPVSYLVGGILSSDDQNAECSQCLGPFSFFSRQIICPACQQVVCIPCSRHLVQVHGKGPHVKVCDRCFIKEKDLERKRRANGSSDDAKGGECPEYAALRQDPSMAKYFRMLNFGVPQSGVAQKMLQDEMPSDKIVIFSAGPQGPEITSSIQAGPQIAKSQSATSRRGSSFRKVHWTSLDTKRASDSIWTRVTSRRKTAPIRLSAQDFQALHDLFGQSTSGADTAAKADRAGSKRRVFTALDSRRSNNISIGLSQFKNIGGADAILKALHACDMEFLTAERLASIYDIAPTAVETKRYTNFRGSRNRLEPSELFLVKMSEIPRVSEKISALLFVAQFEHQQKEIRQRIQLITQTCFQILHCERLARCLELVLAIGNLLNSGTDMADATGVTLESLLKLSETKSMDQTTTLLYFIVRLIHDRGEGDILNFIAELSGLADAKRYSNVICLSQARALQSGVQQVETEIKEEMVIDLRRFEKDEEDRKQKWQRARTPVVPASNPTREGPPLDPRAAMLQAIQRRQQKTTAPLESARSTPMSDVQPESKASPLAPEQAGGEPTPIGVQPSRAAMFAEIRSRAATPRESSNDSGKSTEPPSRGALLAAIQSRRRVDDAEDGDDKSPKTPAIPPRADLLAAIKSRRRPGNDTPQDPSPPDTPRPQAPGGMPPRADLLAAIRNKRRPESVSSPTESTEPHPAAVKDFAPRVYSVEENAFVRTLRPRLMEMKRVVEELELEVESMSGQWEATARYLGEDPVSTSSEYVMTLLNRFVLDVKVARTLLARKGLVFATAGGSLLPDAQVGSIVVTCYGPAVVTALRIADAKVEVTFPWGREAYLSPLSILSRGALVRCRTFGLGVLRETHYDRGVCIVRFGFGVGIIGVQEITPVAIGGDPEQRVAALDKILGQSSYLGDPVVTPFGCGVIVGIRDHPLSGQGGLELGGSGLPPYRHVVFAVRLDGPSDEDEPETTTTKAAPNGGASSGIAYVQARHVRLHY